MAGILRSDRANAAKAVVCSCIAPKLRHWEYLHPLLWGKPNGKQAANPCDSGEMWECPISSGSATDTVCSIRRKVRLSGPPGITIAKLMFIRRNSMGCWTTAPARSKELSRAGWPAGFVGMDSRAPCGIGLLCRRVGGVDVVTARPHDWEGWPAGMGVAKEVQQLRNAEHGLQVSGQNKKREIVLAEMAVCCGELKLSAKRTGDPFEVEFSGGDGASWLLIKFDPSHPKQIIIDGQSLSLDPSEEDVLHLQGFIDASVIELFLNDRQALTKRFYYFRKQGKDVAHYVARKCS